MRIERHSVEHTLVIAASPDVVWREVTEVDLAAFAHPRYLSLLGIPKPLRAEVHRPGVGGARTAFFANDHRFSQRITEWRPSEHYAFTFEPDPGFRVARWLDLREGPLRLVAGAYRLRHAGGGTRLSLASEIELHGLLGACLRPPATVALRLVQRRILMGIRANAERRRG